MADDHQLLAEFARKNSEAAFAALVERHVGLVYSVALRTVGNASAAEEITQAVFIILARKADGLSAKIILSGWLYQTTRLTAANFLRTEIRRQHREQEAYMQSLLNDPQTDSHEVWQRIAPLLDAALDKLGPRDRDALALRFFENKSLAEVGAATGTSENAREPRAGKAAEHFHQARRDALGAGDCGRSLGELGASRTGGAGKFGNGCGDCKRVIRFGINPDPCKRNYENNDLVKNKVRSWRERGNIARWRRGDGGDFTNEQRR